MLEGLIGRRGYRAVTGRCYRLDQAAWAEAVRRDRTEGRQCRADGRWPAVIRIDDASPRARARIAGAVYLLFFVTAVLSALVPPHIGGGPAGVARRRRVGRGKIVANKGWYELGVVLGLFSTACDVARPACSTRCSSR